MSAQYNGHYRNLLLDKDYLMEKSLVFPRQRIFQLEFFQLAKVFH